MNKLKLIAQKRIPLILIGLFALLALLGIILFKMILAMRLSSHCPPAMIAYWNGGEREPKPLIQSTSKWLMPGSNVVTTSGV